MKEKEFFEILGVVKSSPTRVLTLKALGESQKTPTEIDHETNVRSTQISKALKELKGLGLVVCINEEARMGRYYKCTPSGLEILKHI